MHIAGKVALITGGAGGLGKAFATALLQAKASAVCLVDISKNGSQVASDLSKQFYPSSVDFYHCDVTSYDLFKGAFEHVEKKYGGIDIVCNNAGMNAMDSEVERSIKTLRLNLEAVYFGTKLGMDYMDKDRNGGKGGVIVNVASMAAFLPVHGSMCYNASKAGVVGLTQSAGMLSNYEMTGVRVNALCPSFTETPILDQVSGSREAIAMIPGQDILEPAFVAKGFIQLVEDENMCGAAMRVTPQKGIDFARSRTKAATGFVPSKM